MKGLIALLMIGLMMTAAGAESYLFCEIKKATNSSWEYRLPKIEINTYKSAGKFFGQKCLWLQECDLELLFTAPRDNLKAINHHSVAANYNFGLELTPFWATFSIGGRQYIEGNSDGVPAGLAMENCLRLGINIP